MPDSQINAEILVVDDTVASLELLSELLTRAGYNVRPAQDGHMALRSANARPPELILLDVRMPDIDGFEVCRRLKADSRTKDIPVIFLSALSEATDKVTGFDIGAVDYIAKPYHPEEVLARVRTHIELYRLRFNLEGLVNKRTAELHDSQEKLQESSAQLQELTAFLQTVREEERTTIARELHDELGQALTALRIDLGWLQGKCASLGPGVVERVSLAYVLIDRMIQSLRRISEGLRPGTLDVLGLAAAIEHHVDEFRERTGIAISLTMNRDEFDLEDRLATAIFRIVQEALTNISRHAAASEAFVRIEETSNSICLVVADNGRGADLSTTKKTYGLLGMRERVNMFGGNMEITGGPGEGMGIHIILPVERGNEQ